MTDIQAQSLPLMLQGDDIIAQSQTGSGKTAAFGLALLNKLTVEVLQIQGLIICPTRELAGQVAEQIRQLARTTANVKILTICGGESFGLQKKSLQQGAHIIVGTPGRIGDHLRKETINFTAVQTLVLDEADRMLEMGFQETLQQIISTLSPNRQTLLFSATFPDAITQMAEHITKSPTVVKVAHHHNHQQITEHFYQVSQADKPQALRILLQHHQPQSCLIFCNTKKETQELANKLYQEGFDALGLHGDLEQPIRDLRLTQFANRSASILVATDVAARGLDITDLDLVINYEVSRDAEVHVHRIGRTGRGEKTGIACSLYTPQESEKITQLAAFLDKSITSEKLPDARVLKYAPFKAPMATIQISGGKKQKIRPGDIVGALTANKTVDGNSIGIIKVLNQCSFIAIEKQQTSAALQQLQNERIKGKKFLVRLVSLNSKH